MKFVHVPKATLWTGWISEHKQSKQVTIDRDFELAAYTVTQEQWEAVMGRNPSAFSRNCTDNEKVVDVSDEDLKQSPVESVSWEDLRACLKKLNSRDQGKGWKYRLPTEAEWEYGCRNAPRTKEESSFNFHLGHRGARHRGLHDVPKGILYVPERPPNAPSPNAPTPERPDPRIARKNNP